MRRQTIVSLALVIGMFLFSGCDKEDVTCIQDCTDDYLAQQGMVRYQGDEIGCRFFLSLYEYKNKQYFILGSHCADLVSYPTTCNGEQLCQRGDDKACGDFYKNARYVGVIGVKE